MERVALRPAGPEDGPFLFAVYASTREEELAAVRFSPVEKERFLQMQFRAQDTFYRQQFPHARQDVILVGERPAGRLWVDRAASEHRILDIALLAEHRGRGVGSALLRDLLDEAAARRLPMRIHVERANPALRLYRRLGFVEVADRDVHLLLERVPPATAAGPAG